MLIIFYLWNNVKKKDGRTIRPPEYLLSFAVNKVYQQLHGSVNSQLAAV